MFCHKCGTQIAEDAAFCQKCGTKVIYEDAAQLGEKVTANTAPIAAVPVHSSDTVANDYNFKEFVDKHIQATTQFQSVYDLIDNSKPMKFAWICVGVLSVLGLILGIGNIGGAGGALAGLLIMGGFFGYAVTFIASGIIRQQYRDKFYGEFEQDINIEDFLSFLDKNLKTLSPYFHECGYYKQSGGLQTIISNSAARVFKEVTLSCVCGAKKNRLATICIRPDIRNPDSGRKQYIVGAECSGFLIDGRASGFLGHACLIKTAPIMQAAMEYYLNYYRKNNEEE